MHRTTWYAAFETAWHWGSFIAAHALIACILIGSIQVVQMLVFAIGDPKLFDTVPLRYIFDGMDLGILVAFIVLGTVEAIAVFQVRERTP
jgi:hypothetical protein